MSFLQPCSFPIASDHMINSGVALGENALGKSALKVKQEA